MPELAASTPPPKRIVVAQAKAASPSLINEGRCILDSLGLPVYEHLPLAAVFRRDRLLEGRRKYQDGLNFAARDEHKAEAERGLFLVCMELLDEKSGPERCDVCDLYKQAMRHASSAIRHGMQAN